MNFSTISILAIFFCFNSQASDCDSCYTVNLTFDIEGVGHEKSSIFISGYTHALISSGKLLRMNGKENFFCKAGDVEHKEILAILNEKLTGTVSADQVDDTIVNGLVEKYPCS